MVDSCLRYTFHVDFFLENLVVSIGGSVGHFGQHFCSLILGENSRRFAVHVSGVPRVDVWRLARASPSSGFSPGTDVGMWRFRTLRELRLRAAFGLHSPRASLCVGRPPPTVTHWDSILCPVFLSLPPHSLPSPAFQHNPRCL